MALTQMQLIQSLGEAMAWFERELAWGVPPTELRHLCGRIGELYVAMITNGRMATEVNQRGYDVVSGKGERISVKTTAQADYGGSVSFNPNSLDVVDRVIVLRINTEEMQVETLLDVGADEARSMMVARDGGRSTIALRRLDRPARVARPPEAVTEVAYGPYLIRELETGSIEILRDGISQTPVKPILRAIAVDLDVGLLNGNGNPLNTRQLGSQVIHSLRLVQAGEAPPVRVRVEPRPPVELDGYAVVQLPTGRMEVRRDGELVLPAQRILRELSAARGLPVTTASGRPLTTRQLGRRLLNHARRTLPRD
jgi:hypothetical protein